MPDMKIIYNYLLKGRRIVLDIIPRPEASRYIYPPLFTDPEGDSCFSIYQFRWIKKRFFNFFFWNFCETTCHFSLRSHNNEYPRIFQVTGANQNAQKLLSTDLVNTNNNYHCIISSETATTHLYGIIILKFNYNDNYHYSKAMDTALQQLPFYKSRNAKKPLESVKTRLVL